MKESQLQVNPEIKNQLYKSLVEKLSENLTNFYHNIQILGVAGTAIGGTLTFAKGNLEDITLTACLAGVTLFSTIALYAGIKEENKLIHDTFYTEHPEFLNSE